MRCRGRRSAEDLAFAAALAGGYACRRCSRVDHVPLTPPELLEPPRGSDEARLGGDWGDLKRTLEPVMR